MKTVLSFCLAGLIVGKALGAIVPPANLPQGGFILCPHPDPGHTRTLPFVFNAAPNLADLNAAAFNNQWFGDWQFVAGPAAVSGNLVVTQYAPYDNNPACRHGAGLSMQVNGLAGLAPGQQFNWLQYYTETGDSGNSVRTGDPPAGIVFNGGANTADTLPFYSQSNGVAGGVGNFNGGLGSTTFGDFPFDGLPDNGTGHSGSVSFVTYLLSWDGTAPAADDAVETVFVYGSVEWGYSYVCTPEPSSVVLAAMGVVGLVCSRRARWFRRKTRT